MDIYQSFLAGQSLVLPHGLPERAVLPAARWSTRSTSSLEANNTNNGAVRALAINGNRVRSRPATRCR